MKKPETLEIIHDLCVDYDGFNTAEGLKSPIDDIRKISEESIKEFKMNAKEGYITVCGETDCEGCLTKYADDISLCRAHGKQKDKNKLFLDLVKEHPDYPIIPLVDCDVVPNDEGGRFFGNFGFSYVGEFLGIGEKRYQDRDDFTEDWMDAHCDDEEYEHLTNQEFDALLKKICDEQNWKKVIYVYIDAFEGV